MMIGRIFNILWILVLGAVLISAFIYQCILDVHPCPLCLLQRACMIGIAAGALMNLRFGMQPAHYGVCLLFALLGKIVALRQYGAFKQPILGYDLSIWSNAVFSCSMVAAAVLLILYRATPATWHIAEKVTYSLVVLVTLLNLLCYFSLLPLGVSVYL